MKPKEDTKELREKISEILGIYALEVLSEDAGMGKANHNEPIEKLLALLK